MDPVGPFGSHLTVPGTWWTFLGLFIIHWHWAPNWSIMPVLAHVWTLVDPLGTLLDHKKNPHHLFGFHSHKTMKKGNGYPFVVHTGQFWISIQSFESLLWTLLDHSYRTIFIPMIFFQGLKVLVKLILGHWTIWISFSDTKDVLRYRQLKKYTNKNFFWAIRSTLKILPLELFFDILEKSNNPKMVIFVRKKNHQNDYMMLVSIAT